MKVDPRVGATKHHTREEKVEWWMRLLRKHGVSDPEEERLKFGDFAWIGNWVDERPVRVGVELKTVPDLIGSLHSGRLLGHQIPGMIQTYEFRYLVVEGIWKAGDDGLVQYRRGKTWVRGHATWAELSGVLTSIDAVGSISIRQSSGPYETCKLIASLWKWWRRPFSSHTSLLQPAGVTDKPVFTFRKPNQVEKFMMAIHGIGWSVARDIATVYPKMELLMRATPKDLMKIKGVGTAHANRIWYALHGGGK